MGMIDAYAILPISLWDVYSGVCDKCGAPFLLENILALKVISTDTADWFMNLTPFSCNSCRGTVLYMRTWKSLNITEELKQVQHVSD